MSSNQQPPPAAAATTSATTQDNDAALARKWALMEQLNQAFGFSLDAAKQAIDIVGPDLDAAINFIIDSGMGADQGGPVVPIDNCPHMEQHVNISPSQIESIHPSTAPCSHYEGLEKEFEGKGKAKAVVDNKTGTCTSTENWLCLECGVVRCSRYANGHGLVHWESTKTQSTENPPVGHCVQLSLVDLSVWCHVCSAYLHHPTLSEILKTVEKQKFAKEPESAGDGNPPLSE